MSLEAATAKLARIVMGIPQRYTVRRPSYKEDERQG